MAKETERPAVKSAQFLTAADSARRLPNLSLPEVAIAGRSNVGKSTLINKLTGRRKLARTSATPGRTQQINAFKVTISVGKSEQDLALIDLPGFGYAKLSRAKRAKLGDLIVDYLKDREQLKVVCLLNDCRRQPEIEELELRDLCFEAGVHVLVVITKIDKLKLSERGGARAKIAKAYNLEASDLEISGNNIGAEVLWERVAALL